MITISYIFYLVILSDININININVTLKYYLKTGITDLAKLKLVKIGNGGTVLSSSKLS